MTPAGTFPLGELFGWTPPADPVVQAFKNDYRYIVDTSGADGVYLDKFIDDSSSVYYNSWVSGATTATSYEQMRIDPYKYGLVVNYNMHPTIAGMNESVVMKKVAVTQFHPNDLFTQAKGAPYSCTFGPVQMAPQPAVLLWTRQI